MANADKDILITPNVGSASDPKIEFKSGATNGDPITLSVTDDGTITTLSFEGSSGQLFSISNSFEGSIFSVNDVSGIPSIEVLDDGTVKLVEFGGKVVLGKPGNDYSGDGRVISGDAVFPITGQVPVGEVASIRSRDGYAGLRLTDLTAIAEAVNFTTANGEFSLWSHDGAAYVRSQIHGEEYLQFFSTDFRFHTHSSTSNPFVRKVTIDSDKLRIHTGKLDLTDDESPALPVSLVNTGTFGGSTLYAAAISSSGQLQYNAADHLMADTSVVSSGYPTSWFRVNSGFTWGGGATTAMTLSNAGALTTTSNIYAAGGNVDVASGDNRVKFGMWGSGDGTYGIGMGSGYTYGGLSDYALTFQMSNTAARGFWWGDLAHTNAQGAMSLTTNGQLTVASSISVGWGETRTSAASSPLEVRGTARSVLITGFTQTTMATATGSLGAIEIIQDTASHDSFMTFHVSGDYAVYFGLDGATNRLGWGGWSAGANKYQIASMGITNTGDFSATGNVTAYASDERLKENIKPIENALEKLNNISGVTFDWTDESEQLGFKPKHKKNDAGVIAQRVQEVLPQAVAPAPFDLEMNPDDGIEYSKSGQNYLTVQYEKLVPLLVEAIKEQKEIVSNQQTQIDELKALVNQLIGEKNV